MNKINNIENEENKNASELVESHFDENWYNDLMNEIEEEKADQKESDKKRADELTKLLLGGDNFDEYEKLLKVNPEQINLWDLIEDLNKWEWFRDDIKEKLKSNLIDSISPDDIYREYSTSIKEMPFMAKY